MTANPWSYDEDDHHEHGYGITAEQIRRELAEAPEDGE